MHTEINLFITVECHFCSMVKLMAQDIQVFFPAIDQIQILVTVKKLYHVAFN